MSDLSDRLRFLDEWGVKLQAARNARTAPSHGSAIVEEIDHALGQIQKAHGILAARAYQQGDAEALALLSKDERQAGNRIAVEQVKAIQSGRG
jgi:hypothetical protein